MKNKKLLNITHKWELITAVDLSSIKINDIVDLLTFDSKGHRTCFPHLVVAIVDFSGNVTPKLLANMISSIYPGLHTAALIMVPTNYDYNEERYVPISYDYSTISIALLVNCYKHEWVVKEILNNPCISKEKVI